MKPRSAYLLQFLLLYLVSIFSVLAILFWSGVLKPTPPPPQDQVRVLRELARAHHEIRTLRAERNAAEAMLVECEMRLGR
jgi:hypothetical protein